MNQPLLEEQITIQTIEEAQTQAGTPQLKLKTTNGKTYNVFKTKKDGSETLAWAMIHQLPNKGIGMPLYIQYVTRDGNYNGKQYTSKIVRTVSDKLFTPKTGGSTPFKTPLDAQNAPAMRSDGENRSIVLQTIIKGVLGQNGDFKKDQADMALNWYDENIKPKTEITKTETPKDDIKPEDINIEDLPF